MKYLSNADRELKDRLDTDPELWKTIPGNVVHRIAAGWCWEVYENNPDAMSWVPKVYSRTL